MKNITIICATITVIACTAIVFTWHYNVTKAYIEKGYIQQQCTGTCGTIWTKK